MTLGGMVMETFLNQIIDNELIKYEKLMIVLDLTLFPIYHKHLPKGLTTSSFQLLEQ